MKQNRKYYEREKRKKRKKKKEERKKKKGRKRKLKLKKVIDTLDERRERSMNLIDTNLPFFKCSSKWKLLLHKERKKRNFLSEREKR